MGQSKRAAPKRKPTPTKWPKDESLLAKEWSAIREWTEYNEEQIAKAKSIEDIAKEMLEGGIKASPGILRNSCSFMPVWRKYHGEA